jgi:predicted TIM-barrel fold metal-dependent hydrolase
VGLNTSCQTHTDEGGIALQGGLDYSLIDIDQHYYETDDCCTRHLEARFSDRAVHIRDEGGGKRSWYAGDRPLTFDRRPLDWVLAPGDLRRLMSTRSDGGITEPQMVESTSDPAFRDRDARLAKLDAFGVQAAVMFSSFFFENEFSDDPEAGFANLRAYNRWVHEEWGFNYRDRLFAPATLSLLDLDLAVEELERVLAEGARLVMLRTGPFGGRSPADPHFDPFWARVEEAGVPVVLHVSLSTYETEISRIWGEATDSTMGSFSAFQWYTTFMQRPIVDTLASLVFNNLFGRFPGLRVLSIENGSGWVPSLLSDLDHIMHYTQPSTRWPGGVLSAPPSEVLREHLYVSPFYEPYYEAPMKELVEALGIDRLIFGSDWPHGEGKPAPLDYLADVEGLAPGQVGQFMRGNGLKLLGLG